MKKLALKLDELTVETFEPAARLARPAGTVKGAEATLEANCTDETCPSRQPTCGIMPQTYDTDCCYMAIAISKNGCEYSIDAPCCV